MSLKNPDTTNQKEVKPKEPLFVSPPVIGSVIGSSLPDNLGIIFSALPMPKFPLSSFESKDHVLNYLNPSQHLTSAAKAEAAILESKIKELSDEYNKLATELEKEKSSTQKYKDNLARREKTLEKINEKKGLAFLLDRVSVDAQNALLSSGDMQAEFIDKEPKALYAVSIDIRRSTDLMLKARSPEGFANFIMTLCSQLMHTVKSHYGVVDKFTGDGILCFFPDFFSGSDAGYHALAAATKCHEVFAAHYRNHRSTFQSVLADIGLGIGVDYGLCKLVQVAGSLTIVGAPVVYACRLGGAPAGTTLLNQPAYEAISSKHGGHVMFTETRVEIKHEGALIAYRAELARDEYAPLKPDWVDKLEPAASSKL